MSANYAFPVSLQSLYTKDKIKVPQIKAVIREDTKEPISAVSSKYGLIPHEKVFSKINSFMETFGVPEVKHDLVKNGAEVVGSYVFKDTKHLKKIAVGDTVGLQIYARNSYNTNSSLTINIGGLVLSCLNGMVSQKSSFVFRFRHTQNVEVALPDPDEILTVYHEETDNWKFFASLGLTTNDIQNFVGGEKIGKLLPASLLEYMQVNNQPETAWDLMQNATNFVTHQSPKLNPLGKFNRLETISRVFNTQFLKGEDL